MKVILNLPLKIYCITQKYKAFKLSEATYTKTKESLAEVEEKE